MSVLTRRELGQAALGILAGSAASAGRADTASPADALGWRKHFPILCREPGEGAGIYLDSAATTHRPAAVISAIAEFYERDNSNPAAAQHGTARRAAEKYETARSVVARFINARSSDEVVWTRGTTESVNLVASAWAERELRAGDEILLTAAEHASNLLPWRLAAQRVGAVVRVADVDAEGRIVVDDLERKISARTRLIAFSHVSNVAGYINPAEEICSLARKRGVLTFVDAAQSVPHATIDVAGMGCDFLAFSSHKMLGPMGTGVLWARGELLQGMAPYQAGSNMAHDVDFASADFEQQARKFSAGTPNASGAIGLAAAIGFLNSLGRHRIEAHERTLVEHGLERLSSIPGLRLLGPHAAERRLPVFSFSFEGTDPMKVMRFLDERGIAVRAGDLAALPLLKHFGVTRAVRASCYLYNQVSELDVLADALADARLS